MFLNQMYDKEMINLFEKVKDIFDEKNIFNPGKKVYSQEMSEILKKIY
jgi:FAD/FMN-containing dehydrogenase